MKKTILFIFCLAGILTMKATHNVGGYISYEHLSGFNYKITMTQFGDPGSLGGAGFVIMNWGDGSPNDSVPLVNLDVLPSGFNISKYITEHDFGGTGNYTISVSIPNRSSGILNIYGGSSVEVSFHTQSSLSITSTSTSNNSAVMQSPYTPNVAYAESFVTNQSAFDSDGDILSYELITPKQQFGYDIADYFIPEGVTIDPYTGNLKWENPGVLGNYVFAIKITECRNGEIVGTVVVDIQLRIDLEPPYGNGFSGMQIWPQDTEGNYVVTIEPNETIDLDIAFSNIEDLNDVDLFAYGEPFVNANDAEFNPVTANDTYIEQTFNWTPGVGNLRCAPYTITFRGTIDLPNEIVSRDISLLVYVQDETMQGCGDSCGLLVGTESKMSSTPTFFVYPNPFKSTTTFYFQHANPQHLNQLVIYDITGRVVKSIPTQGRSEIILNQDGMVPGVYIYFLHIDSEIVESGRIVLVN